MNKRRIGLAAAVVMALGVGTPLAVAAADPSSPYSDLPGSVQVVCGAPSIGAIGVDTVTGATITGTATADGTLVTWDINVNNAAAGSQSAFALLFDSHPKGSTTSIGPAQHGATLTITGNGDVTFTQSPAPGTTFCGQDMVVTASVDVLEGFIPPPTTTTTQPPATTTTTAPADGPTTTTTTTVPVTPPSTFPGEVSPLQEKQSIVVAPATPQQPVVTTGGNG